MCLRVVGDGEELSGIRAHAQTAPPAFSCCVAPLLLGPYCCPHLTPAGSARHGSIRLQRNKPRAHTCGNHRRGPKAAEWWWKKQRVTSGSCRRKACCRPTETTPSLQETVNHNKARKTKTGTQDHIDLWTPLVSAQERTPPSAKRRGEPQPSTPKEGALLSRQEPNEFLLSQPEVALPTRCFLWATQEQIDSLLRANCAPATEQSQCS